MFEIVAVDSKLSETLEPLGTKRKYWFREGDRRLLFKAEERGTGEDWAEKIACELCSLLGLPHVHYDLAIELDSCKPGVICESCVSKPSFLALGNQVLLTLDMNYPALDGRKYKVRAHTVEAVKRALWYTQPPPPRWMALAIDGVESALDFFIGNVMLDAWIANQDRHHENWGVIVSPGLVSLAPTFDHGASMARNIADDERQERLQSNDKNRQIAKFARRARSAFFGSEEMKRSMTTMEAWGAFALESAAAKRAWLARLGTIDDSMIEKLLMKVPSSRMSAVCREFTYELLCVNRRRLLNEEE